MKGKHPNSGGATIGSNIMQKPYGYNFDLHNSSGDFMRSFYIFNMIQWWF